MKLATIDGEPKAYRFFFDPKDRNDRMSAFAAARLRKTNEPDALVTVAARGPINEGYRVYLDTELIPRLEAL